jgi:hypothetical protein
VERETVSEKELIAMLNDELSEMKKWGQALNPESYCFLKEDITAQIDRL